MSMLAERKSKEKWSINPRGKAWSDDSSKFGQRMLEKMGWSHGKGLGPNGNGIVEHIKLSHKNNRKGMGYTDRNDQWTEHDSNFNSLLQSLSGSAPTEPTTSTVASLEQKSQTSRVRVHYHKFTRGKDLSRYSEKDLANIFGKKTFKELETEAKTVENTSFFNSGSSMRDYFKRKLPNYTRGNGYVVGSNGVLKKKSSEDDEQEDLERKRKFQGEHVNGTPKKMKQEEGFSNPAFDPMFGNVEVAKSVLNTISEEGENLVEECHSKKKRKGGENERNGGTELNGSGDNGAPSWCEEQKVKKDENGCELQENGKVKKKKKKKKAKVLVVDNPAFNPIEQNHNDQNTYTGEEFEVKRTKKTNLEVINDSKFEDKQKERKKKKLVAIDNPVFNSDSEEENVRRNEDFEVRRKAEQVEDSGFEDQKKKQKKSLMALDNPVFDANSDEPNFTPNKDFEVKRKDKKRKNRSGSDNLAFSETNGVEESGPKMKDASEAQRKKKKAKDESLAIDNPSFQESAVEETTETYDLMLNVTSTPVAKKIDSTSRSSTKRKSVRFSNVHEERIIPSNDDAHKNELFDINARVIENGLRESGDLERNIAEMARKIDGFQAEIENDINAAKASVVDSVVDHTEIVPVAGQIKLKHKKGLFGKSPRYMNRPTTRAKSSYKHLIRGDVILNFNGANLHDVAGYGTHPRRLPKRQ